MDRSATNTPREEQPKEPSEPIPQEKVASNAAAPDRTTAASAVPPPADNRASEPQTAPDLSNLVAAPEDKPLWSFVNGEQFPSSQWIKGWISRAHVSTSLSAGLLQIKVTDTDQVIKEKAKTQRMLVSMAKWANMTGGSHPDVRALERFNEIACVLGNWARVGIIDHPNKKQNVGNVDATGDTTGMN